MTKSILLYYNSYGCSVAAVGCPDLSPPAYAKFVRKNPDVGEVQCKYSDVSWTLQCKDTIWVGSLGNCTQCTYLCMIDNTFMMEKIACISLRLICIFV